MKLMKPSLSTWQGLPALCVLLGVSLSAQAQIYRCPNNEYTNDSRIAQAKGCKTLEGGNITIVHGDSGYRERSSRATPPLAARPASASSPEQRARDADARRILEAELAKSEEKLADQQKDYNNGQPDRLGNERNYQKYLDRVAEMKADIGRTQDDIAGLKRELARLPAPPASSAAPM